MTCKYMYMYRPYLLRSAFVYRCVSLLVTLFKIKNSTLTQTNNSRKQDTLKNGAPVSDVSPLSTLLRY